MWRNDAVIVFDTQCHAISGVWSRFDDGRRLRCYGGGVIPPRMGTSFCGTVLYYVLAWLGVLCWVITSLQWGRSKGTGTGRDG